MTCGASTSTSAQVFDSPGSVVDQRHVGGAEEIDAQQEQFGDRPPQLEDAARPQRPHDREQLVVCEVGFGLADDRFYDAAHLGRGVAEEFEIRLQIRLGTLGTALGPERFQLGLDARGDRWHDVGDAISYPGSVDRFSSDGLTADKPQREDNGGGRLNLAVIGEGFVASHPLPERGIVVIGRGTDADLRIDHDSVSRRHAAIHIGDVLEIEDLGSSNGTRCARPRSYRRTRRRSQPAR